ncbi:MAG: TonB family protein [Bacteroidetes bacterium]|nr:TonB family protein [Bacteroidota bacterium]
MKRIKFIIVLIIITYTSGIKSQNATANRRIADKFNLSGIQSYANNQFAEAVQYFDTAILYNKSEADYYRNRADAESALGKNVKALYDLHTCIALQPENYRYQYLAANIYQKIKAYDSAIYTYSKVINLIKDRSGDDLVNTYFNRGNTYLKQEKNELAIIDYDSSISIKLTHYPAYANRGIALYKLNRNDEACIDWYIASINGVEIADVNFKSNCKDFKVPDSLISALNAVTNSIKTKQPTDGKALSQNGDVILTEPEEMPEFPGGEEEMMKYLIKSIKYPQIARRAEISGCVYVTFVVERDGTVTNPRILRGIGGGCDEECLRVVKNMPKWKPGKQKGKIVAVQFNMPVKFTLGG